MNKRKVSKITLEFADGGPNHTYHNIDANFSISNNARKKGGYQNAQEWTEFHITWVRYHEENYPLDEPVEEKIPRGLVAEDFMDDPSFVGIEYGQPRFKKAPERVFLDFGLDGFIENDNGSTFK